MDAQTTALQNLVVAFNNQTRASTQSAGQNTSVTYTGPTSVLVNAGPCRLVNISVVEQGLGTVKFYNSQSLNSLPTDSLLYVLATNPPLGITQVGIQFNNGLCIVVGDGVSLNCTYSIS